MFYRAKDFESWLQQQYPVNSSKPSQYRSHINSLINKILINYGLEGIFTSMGNAIKDKEKTIDKLKKLYIWINKSSALKKTNKNVLAKIEFTPKTIGDFCVALNKYIDFLDATEQPLSKYRNWGAKNWNDNLSDFIMNTIKAVAVDGYDSLINAPSMGGDENIFIKLAVENSYFFCKALVNSRHTDINNDINNKKPLIARNSTDNGIQTIDNQGNHIFIINSSQSILIEIDPDGNKAVRDLIESKTGYTVSSGYDNLFINFKISHIWGNAFDPRFFTSLWNIVLVPSWANDLLDKHGSGQHLALKMINTYKAICEKLYSTNQKWNNLGISRIATSSVPKYVVKGDYSINIIENKKNKPFGIIKSIPVTIP